MLRHRRTQKSSLVIVKFIPYEYSIKTICATHARIQGGPRGPCPPPPPHQILLPQIVRRGPRGPCPPPGGQEGLGPPLQNPGSAYATCRPTDIPVCPPPPPPFLPLGPPCPPPPLALRVGLEDLSKRYYTKRYYKDLLYSYKHADLFRFVKCKIFSVIQIFWECTD